MSKSIVFGPDEIRSMCYKIDTLTRNLETVQNCLPNLPGDIKLKALVKRCQEGTKELSNCWYLTKESEEYRMLDLENKKQRESFNTTENGE